MAKLDLSKIEKKMVTGKNFTLTRAQYLSYTKKDLPQSKYYTENSSAIARKANEYGYVVEVIPEKLVFRKK